MRVLSVADLVVWLRLRGVVRLQADSRSVTPGDAFVAWPGWATDGRQFVPSALAAGAVACVVDAQGAESFEWMGDERVVACHQLKQQAGVLAAAFDNQPSQRMNITAFTGTNGKTTSSWWLAQAWHQLQKPCGLVGTLGVGVPLFNGADFNSADFNGADALDTLHPTGLTTPDPMTLQRTLGQWVQQGIVHCAMEASSIGLVEQRLSGTHITTAVFTNLTQDHLDYHGNMAAYARAKRSLLEWPGLAAVVINVNDAIGAQWARELAQERRDVALWTTAIATQPDQPLPLARLAARVSLTAQGLWLHITESAQSATLHLPVVGLYNAQNVLGVMAVLRSQGVALTRAVQACEHLTAVPGRMQPVLPTALPAAATLPSVWVDYAHTPDALAQALAALRPLANLRGGKLHVVVGCGGNRDASKRPLMAQAVCAAADEVHFTSDNPRHESAHTIAAHMLAGLTPTQRAQVRVQLNRQWAIDSAIGLADPADVVLLAGKGHETSQEVAGTKHAFSDAAVALQALTAKAQFNQTGTQAQPMRQWPDLLPQLPGAQVMGALPATALRVHTDTRTLEVGDIFVALKGEQFDAQQFVPQAAAAGAAIVVAHDCTPAQVPSVQVPDTRVALGEMAYLWRQQFDLPVVAITGSNGKTTVTQMVACIFRHMAGDRALATQGNLNNDIGVPQTLLRMRSHHRLAVVELGMNHPGEIAGLAHMTAPTVALVNNAQREHQEFMDTIEAVAQENGEVIRALPADGTAIFPSDDAYTPLWRELAQQRPVLTFSDTDATAHVHANHVRWSQLAWHFGLNTPQGSLPVVLKVAGRHNVRNALAAAACAMAAGASLAQVVQGLQAFEPVKGRSRALALQVPAGELTVVDDTYNANPDSVHAAIDTLLALPAPHTLVLGDMGEVGEQGLAFHQEVVERALQHASVHVISTGQWLTQAHQAHAQPHGQWAHASNVQQAIDWALPRAAQGGSILIKGSRFMRMEQVVQALQQQWPMADNLETTTC